MKNHHHLFNSFRSRRIRQRWLRPPFRLLGVTIALVATQALGQDVVYQSLTADGGNQPSPTKWVEDSWQIERDKESRVLIRTRPLTLHLRDEPQPALRHRLLPQRSVPGNAAIYYLKAMGFLEQHNAQVAIAKLQQQWFDEAQAAGESEPKPSVWLSSDPQDIDLKQANDYLILHSFQPRELRQAAIRESFDMDRRIEEVDDPISYLLPEIQTMRQLARVQSLRTRVALAEDRVDDAIECIQQQLALAAHLGQEPFLVSNLVGVAIARIACNDILYLMQREDAPNLYWAIATLPQPLVNMETAMEYERSVLYQQLKPLKEVNMRPRSPEYWNDFLDMLAPQFGYFATELGVASNADDHQSVRQALVAYVIAAYPGAKRFLQERLNLSADQIAEYPPTQVVMLATVRYYDVARDEMFKYFHLPYWQLAALPQPSIRQQLQLDAKRYGLVTRPADMLLPAVTAVHQAQARSTQSLAALQTIEAIRVFATRNEGRLPESLDELPLPAGVDPVTGKPPHYQREGESALLTWGTMSGRQNRFRLSVAPPKEN